MSQTSPTPPGTEPPPGAEQPPGTQPPPGADSPPGANVPPGADWRSAAGSPPRMSDQFRSLRRSRSDRVVAGVLGGLGRRLGIDPVLLRVATVVLAIFGGVGVALYAAAWLLVPADDEEHSVLDRGLGRGQVARGSAMPLAIALIVIGLLAAGGVLAGSWDGPVLLMLALAGLVVLLRRRDDEQDTSAGGFTPTGPPAPEQTWFGAPGASLGDDIVPGSATMPARPAGSATSARIESGDAPAGTDPVDTLPVDASPVDASPAGSAPSDSVADAPAGYPPAGWPEGPDWTPPGGYPDDVVEPPTSRPDKPRSQLGLITFCVALIAVGVLAVNDAYWASYPLATYIAAPLAVVGLGLLVGTWFGRSRGLIALGLLLSMALVPAAWLSRWSFDEVGDINQRITSVEQLPADVVRHGGGELRYDLSGLRLADGETARLAVDQGAGELTVVLPADADIVVDATVGAGDMNVLGTSRDGVGNRVEDLRDQGADGPGGGQIVLDLKLGMGDLEVTR